MWLCIMLPDTLCRKTNLALEAEIIRHNKWDHLYTCHTKLNHNLDTINICRNYTSGTWHHVLDGYVPKFQRNLLPSSPTQKMQVPSEHETAGCHNSDHNFNSFIPRGVAGRGGGGEWRSQRSWQRPRGSTMGVKMNISNQQMIISTH
jgi:hypothetical protein